MSFDADLYRRTIKLESRWGDGAPLTMSVVDAGPRDALRTIVFLHGMGGYAAYWHHQLGHLYEGSRVIAPDLRGHGLTDAPHSSYTCDEILADLDALLTAIDAPQRFILITHSFGGALGTLFTHRNPERVEKLVIIGSAVRFDKLNNIGRFVLRAPSWLISGALKIAPIGKRYPPGHVIHAQYRNALTTYDGTPYLQTMTCPCLVILGERDRLFDSKDYLAIAKLIPNALEVTMPVSAHQVMVERPDAVNRAIDRFLGPTQVALERQLRREKHLHIERARPWVKFYDGRTPYQIRPPQGPLQRHLEVAARRFPHTAALQFFHSSISYKKLDRLANRFAEGLRKHGLAQGDRVLIMLPNIPQAVIAYFGTLKAGGVAVFIEANATPDEVITRAQDVNASILIALTTRYAELHQRPLDAGVPTVIFTALREYMGLLDWLWFSFNHHYADGHAMPYLRKLVSDRQVFRFYEFMSLTTDERPEPEPLVDSVALIQYTSGTQGSPQPVMLTHRNLMANSLQIRHWIPEARPGHERILAIWPFSSGMAGTINIAPMLGATVILMPKFDVMEVLHTVKKYRPTILPASPRIYQLLSEVPNIRKYGIASIRVCISAGASLPLELQESFEKLTKGRVIDVYHTTEVGVCIANPLAGVKRSGSMGIPLPEVDVRLVHPHTRQLCGVDEVGELWVKGPQVMRSYWHRPQLDALHMDQDWVYTGDYAKVDRDGFFYLMDRAHDVLLSQDPNQPTLYTLELEEVLYELQEVAEVAVLAMPSPTGTGNHLHAVIVPKAGATLQRDAILNWCASRLLPNQCPSQLYIAQQLPRNRAQKVLKQVLKAQLAQLQQL